MNKYDGSPWKLEPHSRDTAMRAAVLARREIKRQNAAEGEESDQIRKWAVSAVTRRRNPVVPNITDIQPWLYYDRLSAAAAATPSTQLLFFTVPLGAAKTKLDTNLKQAGRLPDPKHFLVLSMRFIFDAGMNLADVVLMNKSYYLEMEIGDKIFAEGHFDTYPGGAGLDGFAPASTAVAGAQSVQNNGIPSPLSVNSWGKEHGIHILQGQSFVVRALAPTPVTLGAAGTALTPGLNVRALLDGILYREVQ